MPSVQWDIINETMADDAQAAMNILGADGWKLFDFDIADIGGEPHIIAIMHSGFRPARFTVAVFTSIAEAIAAMNAGSAAGWNILGHKLVYVGGILRLVVIGHKSIPEGEGP